MTLKEFIETNPSAIEEASKCKTIEEFKALTEKAGIAFDSEEKLSEAFSLVRNYDLTELSDDALDKVSGGKRHYLHDSDNVFYGANGTVKTIGKGKKA